ncbi:unnamed protein product [Candidula unifasciata]|uniref:G-protein coupled receptors family 1 profile domain-containing protein n=1 Tax=Candidula unifasciata TaxID=100452 RepID=A0A8S3ZIE1_9EUPU|nr:unnamed protein product [Candidula unifasciata]
MANISSVENTDHLTNNLTTYFIAATTLDEPSFGEIHGRKNLTSYFITTTILDTFFALAGTLINVWFLAAMLKSPEIRSRLRNKIICGMLAVNLTESAIRLPIMATDGIMSLLHVRDIFKCDLLIIPISLFHIQDFIGNWYIFILVCVYTAQVMNFEPRFILLWKKITTALVITSPLVFALLLVSLTIDSYARKDDFCFDIDFKGLLLYTSLDIIVPLALASLLLVVTAALKYRRYPQIHLFDNLRAQLIDDRSNIDPLCAFVALVVTAVVSDLCLTVSLLIFKHVPSIRLEIWLTVLYVFEVLSFLRLILLPVMLLWFPDIRERIKTWRPCRQSDPQADLVVIYEKNASD